MKINYLILNDSVVLNYGGKTHNIASSDERRERVLQAIRDAKGDEAKLAATIPDIVEIERGFNRDGLELRDGLLMANNEPMPGELNQRILRFKEQKLPYDGLLKFWENLKKNPSYNSRQQLFKFLEHNGHPLTSDGCLIAYRGVTEDFKDAHTKTFDNKPGSVCQMPRESVDDNPNNTCSTGLHVACFNYAKGFASRLVEVKVNPADVVCVPVDYNGTKMRTCKFEVIQEVAQIATDELRTFESEEEEVCTSCDKELCSEYDDMTKKLCEDCEIAKKSEKSVELNGDGESRQLRHAVRGPGGRFVSKE
jgi:hypothetical protein